MTYRKVSLSSGEYFHIFNRGNSKQKIFLDEKDRERFVKLLYLSNSKKSVNFRDDIVSQKIDAFDFDRGETLVSIGAWVLMPNHFHIYLTSPTPGVGDEEMKRNEENKSNITLFVHKLCMSYVKYFNKKYDRTGALFEGPFKSVHIENDGQAKYLFSYIHLNPLKLIDPNWKENINKNIDITLKYLDNYNWSSYNDYYGILRKENKILQRKDFPDYFSDIKSFKSEIFSWLKYE